MVATGTSSPTPAAARMSLHRRRRLAGLRCLTIELRETEVAALVRKGLLEGDEREDARALRTAMHLFLDRSLGGGV